MGFIAPFLVPIVGFVVYGYIIYRREGWSGVRDHLTKTLTMAFLVAVAAELIVYAPIFTFSIAKTIYTDHMDLVTAKNNVLPYNNNLRIIRFERSPYDAEKPIFINLYYRYDGDEFARMRGYYKVIFVQLGKEDRNPASLEKIEDDLWKQFMSKMPPDHGLSVKPKSNGWVSLLGPAITQEQINQIDGNLGAIVLFMGSLRWIEANGDYETDFCAFTQSNPEIFVECANHNGPVRSSGKPTVAPLDKGK